MFVFLLFYFNENSDGDSLSFHHFLKGCLLQIFMGQSRTLRLEGITSFHSIINLVRDIYGVPTICQAVFQGPLGIPTLTGQVTQW